MNRINTRLLNIKYSILMASYWGIVCVICGGFASVFLLSRSFSNMQIGITVAIGNILGVVVQPYLAAVVDSSRRISLHLMTVIMAVCVIVGFVLLYFVNNLFLAMTLIFIVTFFAVQMLQSFTNSISLFYINRGVDINFGLARGMGSAFYAVLSAVLGMLIDRFNENILLMVGIALTAIFIVCVKSMPHGNALMGADQSTTTKAGQNEESFLEFIKKYKGFPFFLAGVMFIFIFHNACNTYLIQMVERVGGTAENMGTALAIAAIVELPAMGLFSILAKKIKSRKFIIFAGAMFVVKAVAYVCAPNVICLYLCQILQMGCYGIYVPASVFYVNEMMDERDTVKGQAMIISAQTLGGVFASVFGGMIIDHFGTFSMLVFQAAAAGIGMLLLILSPSNKNS